MNKNRGKKLIALLAFAAVITAVVLFFRLSPSGSSFLWNISRGGRWLLPLVTVAALLDSVNPCAFSILLITIAFLMSLGNARRKIFVIGVMYILGLFTVYILIGLGILQALHLFNTPHFMAKVGASLLIAFGAVNIINEFFPAFPIKLKIPVRAHGRITVLIEKASLPAAFGLGVLVGLCEFPCTGGPYLMVLGLLHDSQTYLRGFSYLIYYNLLFVLPLVIILLFATNEGVFEKVEDWKRTHTASMRLWSGVAMIMLGLLILAV